MELMELINQIMPKLQKIINRMNDKLIRIEIDEAWDNAILLTLIDHNSFEDYGVKDQPYEMRAIIGEDRIIYENSRNGCDLRDWLEREIDMSLEEYDEIMNL